MGKKISLWIEPVHRLAKNGRDKSRDLENPSLKMKLISFRKKGSSLQKF